MPSYGVGADSRHVGGAWRNDPNRIVRLAIRGEVLPATDEHAGLDFPGAGYNAHNTLGYVTPGIVSNGHLTPGLDRNHGHTGDYWYLATKRGHSYRVEVKFGNSPGIDTGGSTWIYFIDGDRRGTCCESDHNRDDGHTLLHVNHDQNRRYLVFVAAFHHRHRQGHDQPLSGHENRSLDCQQLKAVRSARSRPATNPAAMSSTESTRI